VEPFIGSAVGYLQLTVEGRQWIANLYCNVFEIGTHAAAWGRTAEGCPPEAPLDSEPLLSWSAAALTSGHRRLTRAKKKVVPEVLMRRMPSHLPGVPRGGAPGASELGFGLLSTT
jgi:hypothetical protein